MRTRDAALRLHLSNAAWSQETTAKQKGDMNVVYLLQRVFYRQPSIFIGIYASLEAAKQAAEAYMDFSNETWKPIHENNGLRWTNSDDSPDLPKCSSWENWAHVVLTRHIVNK